MLKRFLQLPIVIVLVITAFLIVWLINTNRSEKLPDTTAESSTSNSLTVSQDGTQSTTNVSGADLQQATPPANSAGSTNTNPQQAIVHYCGPDEYPSDGCVLPGH